MIKISSKDYNLKVNCVWVHEDDIEDLSPPEGCEDWDLLNMDASEVRGYPFVVLLWGKKKEIETKIA